MANDDWRGGPLGGLRPMQQPYGNVRKNYYRLTTNATLGLYIGEPVQLDANGGVVIATTATSLTKLIGAVVGFSDSNKASIPSTQTVLSQAPYLPANTDAWVAVADDPMQLFIIQCNSGTIADTNIGNVARYCKEASLTGRGSSTTGFSYFTLEDGTAAADTASTLQIVGIHDNVNADGSINSYGAYEKVVVRIYHHQLLGDTTTTPI